MENNILPIIKQLVLQLHAGHAVVPHHTATSSKILNNIRALWQAIMDIEQAMERDVQAEPYKSAASKKHVHPVHMSTQWRVRDSESDNDS
jgi:hypothetical protein